MVMVMARFERGTLVRFNDEQNGGPVRRVAAIAPDGTLKRCTICGFVVDAQYAAEKPTVHLRPGKRS